VNLFASLRMTRKRVSGAKFYLARASGLDPMMQHYV